MQVYIGCSGFYNKDWKEVFYPKGLPQSKWFEYYCSRFNTLELNTTFYRFPTLNMLEKWYERSPAEFKFSVKVPRLITHYKQLKECEQLLSDFYTTVQTGLREKLGTVLFQFPAKIKYSEEFLHRITENLDTSFLNVVEFREEQWWNKHAFNQLSYRNIGFSGINIPALPNQIITNTSTLYYRFHGIEQLYFSEYSEAEMQNFAKQLKQAKVETAYIYFNNTATMAAINNAFQLMKYLKVQLSKSGKTAF